MTTPEDIKKLRKLAQDILAYRQELRVCKIPTRLLDFSLGVNSHNYNLAILAVATKPSNTPIYYVGLSPLETDLHAEVKERIKIALMSLEDYVIGNK
jgi:hypothetical protein